MNKSADFWVQRLSNYGHTGWANPAIYTFDQQERLALIEAAINESPIQRGSAIDFGCGTGDFSQLLLSMGFNVCGYDPYVHPVISATRFAYADSFATIKLTSRSADFVLAVTTLDHILDEHELIDVLSKIRDYLKPAGWFYILDYALDSADDRKRFALNNNYESFRLLSEWQHLLGKSSFRVEDVRPVPHPLISPSLGYISYSRSPIVRIRRRFPRVPLPRLWQDTIFKWHARRVMRRFVSAVGDHRGSPLKLIRLQPA
jgi:SAM-dependent methyltransferase